jgi:hypothetical protein
MISIITTTSTSTGSDPVPLGWLLSLILLGLLIDKVLVLGFRGPRGRQLGHALNIAIVPLLIGFVITLIVRVVEVFR